MNSTNKKLLVATVGSGAIIAATGLLFYWISKEKKLIRRELKVMSESLLTSLKEGNEEEFQEISSESSEEFFDAVSDIDDEFYDITVQNKDNEAFKFGCDDEKKICGNESEEFFKKVDSLMRGNDCDLLLSFELLLESESKMSQNPEFLWRLAKAYTVQASISDYDNNAKAREKFIFKGSEYAERALLLDPENPDVNIWFAVLSGLKCDYLPFAQKIENGALFQKHMYIALEKKPEDYFIYYSIGRFKYEIASLSWIERKMGSALLDVPDVTYSDAISDFLRAEELNTRKWKENKLALAKCYIGERDYRKAIEMLDSARKIASCSKLDLACDKQIDGLILKYQSYRK